MPFVNTDNAKIYYETHGEGPAHRPRPRRRRQHTCLVAANRPLRRRLQGRRLRSSRLGQVPVCTGHKHARYFANDMRAVMDDARVERAAVVCQSMGGWTGMQFTLANTERVSCLVLSGTPRRRTDPRRHRSARCPRPQPHHRPRPPRRVERASPGARSDGFDRNPATSIPVPPDVRPKPAHRRHRHRRHRRPHPTLSATTTYPPSWSQAHRIASSPSQS